MTRFFFAVALLGSLAGAGCKGDNPDSADCLNNHDQPGCAQGSDGSGSAVTACDTDADCTTSPAGQACDTGPGKCVQCLANDNKCDLASAAPRCDTGAKTCVACADDNDCSAGAGTCLPDGSCAAPDTIIHAASSNTDPPAMCGGVAPQKPCSLEDALTIASNDTKKKVIRLDDNGTFTPTQNNFVVNANITIEAHSAILHHKNDGPILKVSNAKSLTLLGGTIDGAVNTGGDGIACDGASTLVIQGTTIQNNKESAIDAQGCTTTIVSAKLQNNSNNSNNFPGLIISNGSLTISRSYITGTKGGGIAISNNATFQIVGNAILNNGDGTSAIGAIAVLSQPANTSRLDFNTISANSSTGIVGSGVQCAANSFTAQNNIIWMNSGNQLNGCSYAYSVIGPTAVTGGLDGGHNTNVDPKLTSVTSDPHIQTGSSAIKAANPAADLTGIAAKDIDGDTRTSPADCGADQTH